VLLGSIREILGNGTIFGVRLWSGFNVFTMILPPGGYMTLGLLAALFTTIGLRRKRGEQK
jgi:electron transport complex protein RnfE